jgi:hypothetical protein
MQKDINEDDLLKQLKAPGKKQDLESFDQIAETEIEIVK